MVFLGADVELAPKDRLDAFGGCGFEEMDCAVDIAVVCNRHSFLSNFVDMGDELFDVASTIQKGVVGVKVEVGELSHGDSPSLVR